MGASRRSQRRQYERCSRAWARLALLRCCAVCDATGLTVRLRCGCHVCPDCVDGWASAVLDGEYGRPADKLVCPVDPAHGLLAPGELMQALSPDTLGRYDRAMAMSALGDRGSVCPCCNALGCQ